ncbi:helix-turn-helix domain-containing protein [Thiosulfativibrio zosterae]|uniref:HTH cro/C1-type domain-containing protein n=1 Tax=Thiosulfativibrio zosterae TaxID=2675053 RepID=A0A6F8PN31_9GAMM|nr:helix-turn-helix transcriptional regulator [Thiosulfativibrio zosterae]BBP43531.1 hypothetical protein THMIRHAT_12770 [Thiosulfativibrio zosterae]
MTIMYDPIKDQLDIYLFDKDHLGEPFKHELNTDIEICHYDLELHGPNCPQVISISNASQHGFWPIQLANYSGNPIADLRHKYGLTQADLGAIMKVSKARISQMENGGNVSVENFERVRKAVTGLASSHWANNKVTTELLS